LHQSKIPRHQTGQPQRTSPPGVPDGTYVLDLNGNMGMGGIKQQIQTVIGQQYNLSFYLSGNWGVSGAKTLTVGIGNTVTNYTYALANNEQH
jgi:hypothetical protein